MQCTLDRACEMHKNMPNFMITKIKPFKKLKWMIKFFQG
jgi:hypothetical protein